MSLDVAAAAAEIIHIIKKAKINIHSRARRREAFLRCFMQINNSSRRCARLAEWLIDLQPAYSLRILTPSATIETHARFFALLRHAAKRKSAIVGGDGGVSWWGVRANSAQRQFLPHAKLLENAQSDGCFLCETHSFAAAVAHLAISYSIRLLLRLKFSGYSFKCRSFCSWRLAKFIIFIEFCNNKNPGFQQSNNWHCKSSHMTCIISFSIVSPSFHCHTIVKTLKF